MANLALNAHLRTQDRGWRSIPAANGVTFFSGGLVGINSSGYMVKWANTTGHLFAGILLGPVVGDTSATPVPEGRVDTSGKTIMGCTVAGATTIASTGVLVYCTSDNITDMSTSATSNVKAVGRVARWNSSTNCDVTLFTPEEYMALN
jgi:hypothetical protein